MLAASGAAFSAVVFGQMANALACRSTVRSFWQVGWRTNPLLWWALLAEAAMLLAFLFFPPLADLLGQAGPTVTGLAVALCAIPVVLVADTAQKAWQRRRFAVRPAASPAGSGHPGAVPAR
jgi:magnesium-transporting ATPase (P-type)